MRHDIRKTVVLGAGTMGAQVAAHLVARGSRSCSSTSFRRDSPRETTAASWLARRWRDSAKLKPSPLHLPSDASLIRTGNFEDDWDQLKDADWVFEAVIEDLEIKTQLFSRVAEVVPAHAIVTSNTSGLGIEAMSGHLAAEVRRRFFGTHFFNPPRYLRLLETIPGPDTDPELMAGVERFLDEVVGKGVVRCKDTPNFIGNRIGLYAMALTLRTMVDLDMTIEEVDTLTGPATGRPKSATFRTADIAGVDVVAKVAQNLYDGAPDDPERDTFVLPGFVAQMLERGWLGHKTGGGFYRKDGQEIRTLDWKTLEYRDRVKPKIPAVDAGRSLEDVGERIQLILKGKDKAADFLWRVLSSSLPLRRVAGPGDLRRRGLGGRGHGVGLRVGSGTLPPPRHPGGRRGGGAGPGGGAHDPAPGRGAPGVRTHELLRDEGREDHRLRAHRGPAGAPRAPG